MFPYTQRNFKRQHSPLILDVFGGKFGLGNYMIIETLQFSKSSIFKMAFSKSSALKSVFVFEAPFSWRISVNGSLNSRDKAGFSNFSSVVRTGPTKFSGCALFVGLFTVNLFD